MDGSATGRPCRGGDHHVQRCWPPPHWTRYSRSRDRWELLRRIGLHRTQTHWTRSTRPSCEANRGGRAGITHVHASPRSRHQRAEVYGTCSPNWRKRDNGSEKVPPTNRSGFIFFIANITKADRTCWAVRDVDGRDMTIFIVQPEGHRVSTTADGQAILG